MTDRSSCPDSCPLRNRGCYAEYHLTGAHWKKTPTLGTLWGEFCAAVAALPLGQLWRHNEAGDLPGRGDAIDGAALEQLVLANAGRRGFTYTHKPVVGDGRQAHENREAIVRAVARGFTINLSADTLQQADDLRLLGVAPVVVTLRRNAQPCTTPAGTRVMVCPAQAGDWHCSTCGLCYDARRTRPIIGFRAHGQAARAVERLVGAAQEELELVGAKRLAQEVTFTCGICGGVRCTCAARERAL
jgi:hypothetical protein